MRAAFFHYLPTGGAVRVAGQQIFNLRETFDWRLHIPDGAAPLLPPSGLPQTSYPFPEGARLKRFQKPLAPLLLWKKTSAFIRLCRAIAAGIDDDSRDIALVHTSLILASSPLLYMMETPSVYYCHEYPRYLYEKGIYKTGSRVTDLMITHLLRRDRKLDRMAARAATVLVTNSDYMAGKLKCAYDREVKVVNPAVDTEHFKPGAGISRRNSVLSVGALSEFKGHDLAVRAVGLIPSSERPDLVIIGDRGSSAYGQSLIRMAGRMGVTLRVATSITDTELLDIYRTSRVVICAQRNEPYGLVPLEAMACGTPVIAVNQGGFPGNIIDGTTGFLVPRTSEAIAERLSSLLKRPALIERMGSEGRLFVEKERSTSVEADHMHRILHAAASTSSIG